MQRIYEQLACPSCDSWTCQTEAASCAICGGILHGAGSWLPDHQAGCSSGIESDPRYPCLDIFEGHQWSMVFCACVESGIEMAISM